MKSLMWQKQGKALGCDIDLRISAPNKNEAKVLLDSLWGHILIFEKCCSRFLHDSELSVFNANAGKKQSISPLFKNTLEAASKMANKTDGIFNPFVLPALQRAGYITSFTDSASHSVKNDYRDRNIADWKKLKIGDTWAHIPYNTAIDLGGMGKGFLADILASLADSAGSDTYCINLGGDMICKGPDQIISIQSAEDLQQDIATFSTPNKKIAIATSGKLRTRSGTQQVHQINTRTNSPPSNNIRIVSVVTESALNADVYASAIVVMGMKKAQSLLETGEVLAVLIQHADGIKKLGNGFMLKQTVKES